jgi:hypothetical protein
MLDRRHVLVAVAAGLLVGCGTTASARVARPQIVNLTWHENCGTRASPLRIKTRRLTVGPRRWRVDLSFRNETSVTLFVLRPHVSGGTYFGLETFETDSLEEVRDRAERNAAKPGLLADRFSPSKPGPLLPEEGWSGWFSGPGALPAGVPIRVVLGRFVITGKVPPGLASGFLCISNRHVRLD